MDPLCLALSGDAVAFPILATVIASVLVNTTRPVEVVVYARTVRAESFQIGRLKVEFLRPRVCLANRTDRIPGEMFDRLLVLEDKPEWSRVLVLDWDQLAVGPLDELWDMDLGGTLGAFVKSPSGKTFKGNGWVERKAWGAELPGAGQIFFRFGGLLDVAACRAAGVLDRMLSMAWTGSTEQALLASAMAGNYTPVPIRWNILPSIDRVPSEPRIFHWFGDRKPWTHPGGRETERWHAARCTWDGLKRLAAVDPVPVA